MDALQTLYDSQVSEDDAVAVFQCSQQYDEAVELSDEGEQPSPAAPGRAEQQQGEMMAVTNKPFDEAVELSSEDSVDDDAEREPPITRPIGSAGSSDEAGGRPSARASALPSKT